MWSSSVALGSNRALARLPRDMLSRTVLARKQSGIGPRLTTKPQTRAAVSDLATREQTPAFRTYWTLRFKMHVAVAFNMDVGRTFAWSGQAHRRHEF